MLTAVGWDQPCAISAGDAPEYSQRSYGLHQKLVAWLPVAVASFLDYLAKPLRYCPAAAVAAVKAGFSVLDSVVAAAAS